MFVLLTALILFLTALALLILRWTRPEFRYAWLTASGGALLAWIGVFTWRLLLPLEFRLPSWQPAQLFSVSPLFVADSLAWPYALSLATLALAVILTAVARENFPAPVAWAGILTLTGLGLLAVVADNPLTLVLVWAAIDLAELVTQLRSVHDPAASERVVISFAARAAGIGLLLWADMLSVAAGAPLDFRAAPPQAGLFLVMAAGLRLGVLPLHLPYAAESALRRGFGTTLRLVSAASSLALLARIPAGSLASPLTPFLLTLTALAALYGGWMWLRSPDELSGRPFWLIGLAALAVASALRANPAGSVAWGCALILAGGALFLASVQQTFLSRALLAGAFGAAALPFSLTAVGWQSGAASFWPLWPFFVLAHALLLTGFIRHAWQPSSRATFKSLPIWAKNVYPAGILLPLIVLSILGLWGWDGALNLGAWPTALAVIAVTAALLWLTPRLRGLSPTQAHWVRPPTTSWLDWFYRGLWSLYHLAGRLSSAFSAALEGDGGIMWMLLFMALFASVLAQRTP